MKIICTSNTGAGLSAAHFLIGYTKDSRFSLVMGHEYTVHAMSIWRSALMVLLLDANNLPNWYPIEIFEVLDGHLPKNWFFRKIQDENSLLDAIWGYKEIVLDSVHYDALIDRVPDAIKIFTDAISGSR